MSALTHELLSIVRASNDVTVLRKAIDALSAALFTATESIISYRDGEEAPIHVVAPFVTPEATAAVLTKEELAPVEGDEYDDIPTADERISNYDEIYGGNGMYLLLDDEDEIDEGDEWIIKPECETNRVRSWRRAADIGAKAGAFSRSNYRRAI